MIIKPKVIRGMAMTTHPIGCKQEVLSEIEYVKNQGQYVGAKKALIVGASSGYGLATRISLAFAAGADTIGISFENGPDDKRQGTAGWWNNIFFKDEAEKAGLVAKNFIGDAFSDDMRNQVIEYIKKEFGGKIDLLVYSLASPKRMNPRDGVLYSSTLKSTTTEINGPTINLDKGELVEGKISVATPEDIAQTVKVMGGEDWKFWIEMLKEAGVLSDGFKTVAYSYIGPKATYAIYKDGTIGAAKRDLEKSVIELNKYVQDIHGEALISVNKAVVTKASAFIPLFSVYAAALYKVMKEMSLHEGVIEHTDRLFRDMMYGNKRKFDDKGMLRPDSWEMREDVQERVVEYMKKSNPENFKEFTDYEGFYRDFMNLSGFCIDGVDYDADVDMVELSKRHY
ncbi:MAG: trans-2-enoyl-CoA reductase family protein [Fusobacteria bacterium]|nr:trans-2-enoyl-CoA reductase family protein [Fusobacteriota bacterium]